MCSSRPLALMTPWVTVCCRPSGLPTARAEVADLHVLVAVGELGGRLGFFLQVGGQLLGQADDGQVGDRVRGDGVGVDAEGVAAGEGEPQPLGAGDDVVVGEDVAGLDDEPGADAGLQVAAIGLGIVDELPLAERAGVLLGLAQVGDVDDVRRHLADHLAKAERREVDALVELGEALVGVLGLGLQLGAALEVDRLRLAAASLMRQWTSRYGVA